MAWYGMERPNSNMPSHISLFISYLFFHNLFSVHIPVVSSFSVYSPLSFFHSLCVCLLFSAPLFVLFVVHSWHVYVFIFSFMSKNCISGLSVECTVRYGCLYVRVSVCLCACPCRYLCELGPMWWLVFDTDHIISSNSCILYIPCM